MTPAERAKKLLKNAGIPARITTQSGAGSEGDAVLVIITIKDWKDRIAAGQVLSEGFTDDAEYNLLEIRGSSRAKGKS